MDFYSVKDVRELHGQSPIARYFYGKSVLLTGASGFLGQLYLEKLLRIGVKDVYILLRAKKGLSPMERIAKIVSSAVFAKLRQVNQQITDRIKVVTGDLSQPQLGISDADVQLLSTTINLVIHSGADVRFDISLPEQILSNVRGTKCLLELATRMKQLEQFVYVSTAYSHCVRSNIDECFYPAPMDTEFMIANAESWINGEEAEIIDFITQKLIYPWPNSYTFSKALSEELVRRYSRCFSTLVVRPSIIISTRSDPLPGWTNNVSGMNGVMLGIGIGFLRNLKIDANAPVENVHADYVTNGTLSAMWFDSQYKRNQPKVLHITHKGAPMTVGKYLNQGAPMVQAMPLYSNKCIWYPCMRTSKFALENYVANMVLHVLPALILDLFNVGKEIRFIRITRKMEALMSSFAYFMAKPLNFGNEHMVEIQNSMNNDDKRLFACDTRDIDLLSFMPSFFMGLRIYIMNDPLDTLPASMKRKRIQKIAHSTLIYTLWFLAILFLYAIFG